MYQSPARRQVRYIKHPHENIRHYFCRNTLQQYNPDRARKPRTSSTRALSLCRSFKRNHPLLSKNQGSHPKRSTNHFKQCHATIQCTTTTPRKRHQETWQPRRCYQALKGKRFHPSTLQHKQQLPRKTSNQLHTKQIRQEKPRNSTQATRDLLQHSSIIHRS